MSAQNQKLMRNSLIVFFLTIGALVFGNVIASQVNLGRFDTTEARLWSLSDGSRRLVGGLDDRMEVVAYFTEDLPPPFNATEQYVRDLLGEYEASSGGKLHVRFVNPDEDEERQAAESDGIQRVAHQVVENDSVSVREGYRGLVIRYLGETKTLPVIENPSGLEYSITTAIKQLLGQRTQVGVLSGHEGPTMEAGLTGLREGMPHYDFRDVAATSPIDGEFKALLIIAPKTALSEDELRNIDQFVMNGGSLGVFGGSMNVAVDGPSPAATATDTGLNRLLSKYGAQLNTDVVLDAQCSRVPMRGPMGMQVAVPYPPVVVLAFNDEQKKHNAVFRLENAIWPFSSSIELTDAPEGVDVEVLGQTSEQGWVEPAATANLEVRNPNEWNPGEFAKHNVLVAISGRLPSAFAGNASSSDNANARSQAEGDVRVLVAGTGAFLRDEFLPQPGPDGQRDLSAGFAVALNAIDWLGADADLIAIRAKNVEDPALNIPENVSGAERDAIAAEERALEAASQGDRASAEEAVQERDERLEERKEAISAWDARKARYRWLNTLGIPALLAVFGVIRWRMRAARKYTMKDLGKGVA